MLECSLHSQTGRHYEERGWGLVHDTLGGRGERQQRSGRCYNSLKADGGFERPDKTWRVSGDTEGSVFGMFSPVRNVSATHM